MIIHNVDLNYYMDNSLFPFKSYNFAIIENIQHNLLTLLEI